MGTSLVLSKVFEMKRLMNNPFLDNPLPPFPVFYAVTRKHMEDWLYAQDEISVPFGAARLFWINARASDKDLRVAFESWLKERSKPITEGAKKRRESDDSRPNKLLLPYVDLKLWQQWSGNRLTEAMLECLLFEKHFNPKTFDRTKLVPMIRQYKRLFNNKKVWELLSHSL